MVYANDDVYNDPRLVYHEADACAFLSGLEKHVKYDVIVLDLPDPDAEALRSTAAATETATAAATETAVATATETAVTTIALYSVPFFRMLKEHLAEDGVIATHCGPVMPGGDPQRRRAGLHWIQKAARLAGLPVGTAYHAGIPSFQGEWGFWMSTPPSATVRFPTGLIVMDSLTQTTAFSWPDYWLSSFVGLTFL
jgi:predicted membrane-bound spermidine synthase